MSNFSSGLDVVAAGQFPRFKSLRLGLLANQASVDRHLRTSWELLAEKYAGQLTAVFSPQHGLWSEQQANMIESPHGRVPRLELPLYSLYSETRQPTQAMLEEIDLLVIDLQDVGSRIYTFIWTMVNCLKACAQRKLPVVILDRPNPLGSELGGPILLPDFHSFVGMAPLPLQHDLTIGEVALLVNSALSIHAQVEVIRMDDWQRSQAWPSLNRLWIPPSPNLPTFLSVRVYPGQVLLEGTNVSEGRGTTCPFEIMGAPWIDGSKLAAECNRLGLEGILLRPIRFVPQFDKWSGQSCGGIFLHPLDDRFQSIRTSVMLIATIAKLWPEHFRWLAPPYEYEYKLAPIDILFGNDLLRKAVDSSADVEEVIRQFDAVMNTRTEHWRNSSADARLYD